MATNPNGKPTKSSFGDGDILESSFDGGKLPLRRKSGRGGLRNSTSDIENIFSILDDVNLDEDNIEGPEMNAASKKTSHSTSAETKKLSDNKESLPEPDILASDMKPREAGGKKIDTSSARNKKFSFLDLDDQDDMDDLDDLLDSLPQTKKKTPSKSTSLPTKPEKSTPSHSASLGQKRETTSAAKKLNELVFDDEKDDLIDELGLDCEIPKKKENVLFSNRESDQPQRPRTKLDEILENCNSQRPEWPPPGGKKDQSSSREKNYKEVLLDDDLTFGSYQPTVGDNASGPQSRQQSIRFPIEDVSASSPEKKPPIPPTSTRARNPADWLCLSADDEDNVKEKKTSIESPKSPSPLLERKRSLSGEQNPKMDASVLTDSKAGKPEVIKNQKKVEEDDDWLVGALSRKKSFSGSNFDDKILTQEQNLGLGEEVDLESLVSKEAPSQAWRGRNNIPGKQSSSSMDAGILFNSSLGEPSLAAQHGPEKEEKAKQVLPQPDLKTNSSAAVQQQVPFSADSLQQLLLQQQMMQSQLLGLRGVLDAGAVQKVDEHIHGDGEDLQARIIQLEAQAKTLQLERDHSQMLLESIQQRHKQDMELMENAHKTRVKLLEESAIQREMRMRQESEDLIERLAALTQTAEKERSELQAHYQKKLAQFQQDQDRDIERLRDLQRKSITEMKKDHEDHINRLKRLKEEEIDAVTSATSETRSLTLVIEKMEQFSFRLGDLSSLVESRHEHTTHGLEQGARHRDEQLRSMCRTPTRIDIYEWTRSINPPMFRSVMQDRLAQQEKIMAEEKAYLKEIISKMDTQINEQQRQIEKDRWKMTGEQAKVESSLKSLEEERRALTMQMTMEREELERAKRALLEEQKAVMQHCAEERRKLAAEWNVFHAQEKQRREKAEQDVSTLLERREGSIMSLAQEQADLKLRSGELKLKETAVAQEREVLEKLKGELEQEKERISTTALRLKIRAQEVDSFSKLAAEKYEEGEQALREAKRVESEHQARLRTIHSQIERLRQLEQRALQERIRVNPQETTEKSKLDPPSGFLTQTTPTLPDLGSAIVEPKLTLNTNQVVPNSQSVALQATLAIWKYNAHKEHDYLQEQQVFLENLKKKSNRLKSQWATAL
ncbi:fas-binding factor 1 homolog isoform X2 [Syngnathus scovelli]|uniref:fas-binding factor 1 homolog isoform X2 n=1 Tax=Syngnathus scovelli TaxID=161590 RepID=UPI00210FFE06|nr:fas-binding factor 1 homolog isoform X2 [Syngnathus scovelli]